MASFRETISILLSVDEKGAVSGIKSFRDSVKDADGFTGKFKAAAGGAFQYVKDNAMAMGLAAAGAATALAFKGVADFQNLGVEIGKLSDATGLSYDKASRWREVMDDAGVSADTFEGSVGRFNKTLGAAPGLLESYGGEIKKAKDGTVDVNETFLNAIDTVNGIKDPTKQAEAAAKLFGRGWQEMGELVNRGSGQLRTDLAAVDEAKIFDKDKVDKARDLRDGFDSIKDAAEGLMLKIGGALAPVVADLAPKLGEIIDEAGPLAEALGSTLAEGLEIALPLLEAVVEIANPLAETLGAVVGAIEDMGGAMLGGVAQSKDYQVALAAAKETQKDLADKAEYYKSRVTAAKEATKDAGDAFDDAGAKAEYYRSRVEAATDETEALRQKYRELQGELSDEESWLAAQDAVDSYKEKVSDANATIREKQQALIEVKQKLLEYTASLEGVKPEVETQIVALIDQGKIDEAEAKLAQLSRPRNAPINPMTGGAMVDVASGRRAAGGPVRAGQAYIVGDNPDGSLNATSELFVPDSSGTILSASDTRRTLGGSPPSAAGAGGAVMNVRVETSRIDARSLTAALRDLARSGIPNPWG